MTHQKYQIIDQFTSKYYRQSNGKNFHKHVFHFFKDKNVITTLQSGFVPGDSTTNQLRDIYNTFCKALDEGKEVHAVFCDVSKAFDRVWHKGLLYKLNSVGIIGTLL